MKILVINSGSSSIKFTLFQMDTHKVIAKAVVERIDLSGTHLSYKTNNGVSIEKDVHIKETQDAVTHTVAILQDENSGVI